MYEQESRCISCQASRILPTEQEFRTDLIIPYLSTRTVFNIESLFKDTCKGTSVVRGRACQSEGWASQVLSRTLELTPVYLLNSCKSQHDTISRTLVKAPPFLVVRINRDGETDTQEAQVALKQEPQASKFVTVPKTLNLESLSKGKVS